MELTLKHPIDVAGATMTALRLRRANVGDLEAVDKAMKASGELAGAIVMLARLSGNTEDLIRTLDAEDFAAASEKVAGFFPKSAALTSG